MNHDYAHCMDFTDDCPREERGYGMINKLDAYTEYVMDSIVEDIRDYLFKDEQAAFTIFPEFLGVHGPYLASRIIDKYPGVVIYSRIAEYKQTEADKRRKEKDKKIEEAKALLEEEGYEITKANSEEEAKE